MEEVIDKEEVRTQKLNSISLRTDGQTDKGRHRAARAIKNLTKLLSVLKPTLNSQPLRRVLVVYCLGALREFCHILRRGRGEWGFPKD